MPMESAFQSIGASIDCLVMSQRHSLVGTGLYSLQRAARLVGADLRRVRRWLLGSSRKSNGTVLITPALWPLQYSDDEEPENQLLLGFKDLMELRIVARLVSEGVSLQAVRATIEVAREHLGPYPLQSKRFLTDGKRIFMEAAGGPGRRKQLLDVRGRQFVFDSVIRPSLYGGIDFDAGGRPLRWFPVPRNRDIVLDPARQFGHPIIERSGLPTDTLYMTYLAEDGDRAFVASIYDVSTREVASAVDFEKRLAA
jgi:uncharacterized protein (DUF433 family)